MQRLEDNSIMEESVWNNFIKRLFTGLTLASGVVSIFLLCPRIATSALMAILLAVCSYEYSWLIYRIKPLVLEEPSPSMEVYALSPMMAYFKFKSKLIASFIFAISVTLFIDLLSLLAHSVKAFNISNEVYISTVLPYMTVSCLAACICASFVPTGISACCLGLSQVTFLVIIMDTLLCPFDDIHCSYVIDPAFLMTSQAFIMCIIHLSQAPNVSDAYLSVIFDQLGIVYLVGLIQILSNFVVLSVVSEGRRIVLVLLFSVWAADSGSYFTGHFLRWIRYTRHHPIASHLSPNKDYEGTLGGILCALGVMYIVTSILNMQASHLSKIFITTISILFSRCGDLFESLIKRAAQVKDSSQLIPGHGGFLDRVDALLFACIVFALYNMDVQLLQ